MSPAETDAFLAHVPMNSVWYGATKKDGLGTIWSMDLTTIIRDPSRRRFWPIMEKRWCDIRPVLNSNATLFVPPGMSSV